MEGIHLGGVCGVYCGACTIYRARHDYDRKNVNEVLAPIARDLGIPVAEVTCEGCLSDGPHNPTIADCEIRNCAAERPGVTRCVDCSQFPCTKLEKFTNDGIGHHAGVIDNIRRQQKLGVYEWLQEEFERVRCQYCGCSQDWYAGNCHRCGTKNPQSIATMSLDGVRLQPYYRK